MNNLDAKSQGKNITIIILSILLIIALGFICFDKFLSKEKAVQHECKCSDCEKCDTETNKIQREEESICELDMKDNKELDVYSLCNDQGISNTSNVKIKNISINDKNYVLFHDFEPFYDSKGTYVNYNGVTKLYLNGILLDVYKGQNREALWTIRIEGSNIIISETWPSESSPVNYTYDLKDFNYANYTYDLENLM